MLQYFTRSADTACTTQRFPVASGKQGERDEEPRVEVS